ncbi:GNAT family N-acetyltransferase [Arhodomonas sp. AD133]|uniref:GNAT family N-acetyltransferase n=1 Tax=Arhodomonas sp. AD133 TaxID=3415009 RepID=UPI003EB81EC9
MTGTEGKASARVVLRPTSAEDREALFAIYASTRTEELALLAWSESHKDRFLRMQFEAQDRHYRGHFPDASFQVIEVDGGVAGRLYVDRRADEIRIVDIALLPAYRNAGIGGGLLAALIEEGSTHRLPVSVHVEKNNPALRLYRRLGFREVGDAGVYWLLRRDPDTAADAQREPGSRDPCRGT